jgi:hypothetical protein
MTPEARAIATAKAAGRRHRLTRIRKAVAVLALACFIALFSGIYVQMAAGRDPVLSAKSSASKTEKAEKTDKAAKSSAAPPASTATPSSSPPSDSWSPPAAAQPAPVTTSQS